MIKIFERINFTQPFIVLAIYALLGLVAYFNAFSGPFMFDDYAYFDDKIKNMDIGFQVALDAGQAGPMEGARVPMWYRPAANLLLMGEYFLFGEQTVYYHLFGLIFWILAAFSLYLFLLRIYPDRERIIFLAGLLYVLHPINGIVINYMTASIYALQVIVMLLALHLFLNRRLWWSLVFFVFALMCHESALLLPVFAVALSIVTKKDARATWPWWLLALAYFIFRIFYASLTYYTVNRWSLFAMNPVEYLATLIKLTWWYVYQLFLPKGIVVLHTYSVVRANAGWYVLLGVIIITAIVYVWRRFGCDLSRLGFVWFACGFIILPAAALLQPRNGMMIEPHWFVFASGGFFLMLSVFIHRCNQKNLKMVLCALLLVWMTCGWRLNYLWSDEKRYGAFWFKQSPAFLTLSYHMARIHEKDKDTSKAQFYYEYAYRHNWRLERVAPALGWMYLLQGRWLEAKRCLKIAIQLEPKSPQVWTNLGVVYYKLDDFKHAQFAYEMALKADPTFKPPQLNLDKMRRDGKI